LENAYNEASGGFPLQITIVGEPDYPLDVRDLGRLHAVSRHAQDQVDQRVDGVIVLLRPKAEELGQELLAALSGELDGAVLV
jgi:hypothetical protein